MNDPSYEINLETGTLVWNDAFYRTFGYDRLEHTDSMEWWTSHVHPEDAMLLNDALDQLRIPIRKSWIVAYRLRKADGSYAVVTDHAEVRRDYAGHAIQLNGTLTLE